MTYNSKRALRSLCLIFALIGVPSVFCRATSAADYVITASGPLSSQSTFSDTFDGTTHGELPPLLDVARLTNGTFQASFRFSMVTPPGGGLTTTFYDLSATTAGISFDLLDASGQLVHHGDYVSGAEAIVSNNYGGAPYTVDQVLLDGLVSVTGSHFPDPVYSPPGEKLSIADVNFYDYVGAGVDYVTDLSIPIEAATYLAFPNKFFDLFITFGDGDYGNFVDPFQYVEHSLAYEITSLSVMPVPEPYLIHLLLPALSAITLFVRRR